MKKLLAVFVLAVAAHAQDLPNNFMAVGLGFQGSATPHASGWVSIAHKISDRVYASLATDYSGTTTTQRAEVDTLLWRYKSLLVFGKAGAGAAQGDASTVGGSFSAGGVAIIDISKLSKIPNTFAVGSISATKNDISEFTAAGLRAFGTQAVSRFGFGWSW